MIDTWSDIWKAPLHDFSIRDEILYQYLPLSGAMKVLEVGPGSGITAFRVAPRVRHLTLLEVAPGNLERLQAALREIRNLTFICDDVCRPGLARTIGVQFDAVYGLEVFELLPDPASCLRNLAALLRPSGHLALQFPNYPPPRSPGVTHFTARAELDRLFREAGLQSWVVYGLRLRPHAKLLFEQFHERPLRLYRRLRHHGTATASLIYDHSWTFQHSHRLEPYKYLLHCAWMVLTAAMRAGGDCFERTVLGDDILNRNLLVLARR